MLTVALESATAVQRARRKLQRHEPLLGGGGDAGHVSAHGEPTQVADNWVHVVPLNDHCPRDRCINASPALLYSCGSCKQAANFCASAEQWPTHVITRPFTSKHEAVRAICTAALQHSMLKAAR